MSDQLRWEDSPDGSGTAYDGSTPVGYVTAGARCEARSADGTVTGTHISPTAARAELEGWFRWTRAAHKPGDDLPLPGMAG